MDNKEFDVFSLYMQYMKLMNQSHNAIKKKSIKNTLETTPPGNDEPVVLSKGEYLQLIDLALETDDKKWFLELTQKMQSVAV
ncbi:IDEAL domain-containing protein [Cytobacillus solani]|uniref:IDEAL domain-containing protein n=1 Tax=Cytobacillus solani TaxID=1637975 RepID=A0A0Q3SEI3_9BACI|nr:IDEAL domain-containing protein [Cytobacillus solani]KQL17668.1 hypothetical protein AN957_02925 [Cytobacillus solani]